MERYTMEVDNKHFSILDYSGDEGTIIAIHGLTGNQNSLSFYADALAKRYRIITYDIRGRGDSSQADENTSIYSHADDLMQLIDKLKIENPILLGYSMGGYIAALVASRREDIKAVVLLDGGGTIATEKRDLVQPSISRLEKTYPTLETYIKEVNNLYSALNVTLNERVELNAKYEVKFEDGIWKNKSDAEAIRKDFDSFYSFEPSTVFSNINCKTLLITAKGNLGDNPPLFDDNSYVDVLKSKQDIELYHSACNHYTLVQQAQPGINQVVNDFLNFR